MIFRNLNTINKIGSFVSEGNLHNWRREVLFLRWSVQNLVIFLNLSKDFAKNTSLPKLVSV